MQLPYLPSHFPVEFGPYQLIRLLGQGSCGYIYMAEIQGQGGVTKSVALKIDKRPQNQDSLEMINEVLFGGVFKHTHIIDVYEVGRYHEHLFLSMEWNQGPTLYQLLNHFGPLPQRATLEIALHILYALNHIHTFAHPTAPQGIIHRDLKPSNLFIHPQGFVLLADFGIAVPSDESNAQFGGTLGYLAPEQLFHEPLSAQSDLFSLGVIIYECLIGQRLLPTQLNELLNYFHEDSKALFDALEHPNLSTFHPLFLHFLKQCLHPKPLYRAKNARNLIELLQPLQELLIETSLADLLRQYEIETQKDQLSLNSIRHSLNSSLVELKNQWTFDLDDLMELSLIEEASKAETAEENHPIHIESLNAHEIHPLSLTASSLPNIHISQYGGEPPCPPTLIGREALFTQVWTHFKTKRLPLCLWGPSGSGKSTLALNFIQRVHDDQEENPSQPLTKWIWVVFSDFQKPLSVLTHLFDSLKIPIPQHLWPKQEHNSQDEWLLDHYLQVLVDNLKHRQVSGIGLSFEGQITPDTLLQLSPFFTQLSQVFQVLLCSPLAPKGWTRLRIPLLTFEESKRFVKHFLRRSAHQGLDDQSIGSLLHQLKAATPLSLKVACGSSIASASHTLESDLLHSFGSSNEKEGHAHFPILLPALLKQTLRQLSLFTTPFPLEAAEYIVRLPLHAPSVFSVINTLRESGYLSFQEETGFLTLHPKIRQTAYNVLQRDLKEHQDVEIRFIEFFSRYGSEGALTQLDTYKGGQFLSYLIELRSHLNVAHQLALGHQHKERVSLAHTLSILAQYYGPIYQGLEAIQRTLEFPCSVRQRVLLLSQRAELWFKVGQ